MLRLIDDPAGAAPPKKAKRQKPPLVYKPILAKFEFNDKEMRELGTEAGRLNQEINTVLEDAKSTMADYKSRADAKKAALNAVSTKLTNGYEMRETMCEVRYFPKDRKKRYYEKGTKKFIREDEMTGADFDLPLFKKEELDKTKSKAPAPTTAPAPVKSEIAAAVDPKRKKKKNTKGESVIEAIVEAAKLQPKAEFLIENALTVYISPAPMVKAWKKAAGKAKWDKTVADNLGKLVLAEGLEHGMDAAAAVLRPFCVTE